MNSFTDNGDDTITDSATGLTWLKNDSGDSSFSSELSSTIMADGSLNFQESLAFCENLTFAGRSDWRLPDAKELHSIVDYTRAPDSTSSAAIDPLFSTTQIINEAGQDDFPAFWSSTTHLDGPDDGYRGVYVLIGRGMGYMQELKLYPLRQNRASLFSPLWQPGVGATPHSGRQTNLFFLAQRRKDAKTQREARGFPNSRKKSLHQS